MVCATGSFRFADSCDPSLRPESPFRIARLFTSPTLSEIAFLLNRIERRASAVGGETNLPSETLSPDVWRSPRRSTGAPARQHDHFSTSIICQFSANALRPGANALVQRIDRPITVGNPKLSAVFQLTSS